METLFEDSSMKGSSGGGVGRVGGEGEVQQELLKDQLLQRAQ